MGLLAFVRLENVQTGSLLELEFMGFSRLAKDKSGAAIPVSQQHLNVGAVTIGQTKVLHQILHLAARTFYVETGFQHWFSPKFQKQFAGIVDCVIRACVRAGDNGSNG